MKKLLLIGLFLLSLVLVAESKEAKYIFLFIGDGLSFPQRMLTEEYLNKTANKSLLINNLPYQAVTTTNSANAFITDSAASGTAIACGEKTNNGFIGVAPDGKRRLHSVAELAKSEGRKVGIVSSVTINHATPAAFYGHQVSRDSAYALGLELIASNFDYFAGGGLDKPNDTKNAEYKGNIYDLAKEAGYIVSDNPEEIRALQASDKKVFIRASNEAMPYEIDRDQNSLSLAEFTQIGINLLKNDNGFFMMVEGGKIDWVCHSNDAATVLHDIIAFDEAVKVAYEFAQKYPEETLIVVTGDHETGGLTLGFAGTGYSSYIERLQNQTCSLDVFHAKITTAKKNNNDLKFEDVKPIISESFGLVFTDDKSQVMRVTSSELKTLETAFNAHFANWTKENPQSGYNLTIAVAKIFNNKAGIAWTTNAHTALPVNTTAYGVGGERFTNAIDNTSIAKILKELIK